MFKLRALKHPEKALFTELLFKFTANIVLELSTKFTTFFPLKLLS